MNDGVLPIFVKWAGGKSQLIQQFKPLLPPKFNTYFEPFVGGGAVFFYVQQNLRPKAVFLSDTNKELINCYSIVKSQPNDLLKSLEEHKRVHSNQHFYDVRRENPERLEEVERAARFVYLNKTCFNGLYRVNSKGEFNVPFGYYRNPMIVDSQSILLASKLLKGVHIKLMPSERVLDYAKSGDFVYFDPPYVPISRTSSFTSYTADSFGETAQKKLAETFERLDERGCYVMLSNSSSPIIRELYQGYDVSTVRARRAISSIGTGRGRIDEFVVRNYSTKDLTSYA